MTTIPKELRAILNKDPFMKVCCLNGEDCEGKLEFHHTIIFGGAQLQERWAIVPACERHHRMAKDRLELIALNRATDYELLTIGKAVSFIQRREYLRETLCK